MSDKAVVLLSGGLDSATCLAEARAEGLVCHALSFDYAQRHSSELAAAKRVAKALGVAEHKVIDIDLRGVGGSALTDSSIAVPEGEQEGGAIPVTYVPARNTLFLAYALGWAEVLAAKYIYIGVNAVDYSGYPDCRPEFIQAFQAMADVATKAGVEAKSHQQSSPIMIRTPLIQLSKADIITRGIALGVDYSTTVSCYQAAPDGRACGHCDSCRLRKEGFKAAGVADPTLYCFEKDA